MRRFESIVLTILLTTVGGGSAPVQPQVSADQGVAHAEPGILDSGYVADLDAVRGRWPDEPTIETIEDAFRVRVVIGDRGFTVDTHLFGDDVRVIPYDNGDDAADAEGRPFGPGDAVLARYFPLGKVGFAVKHRRPAHRQLLVGRERLVAMTEHVKLWDSHLQILIGVERNGRPGVITLSNPQTYENGRFGTAAYPMIFFEPVLPDYLSPDQRSTFLDNIRTMMVGFNSVSKFPWNYYRGDPLTARNVTSVRLQTAMMVRAIAGDLEARDWFARDENLLYCSELAVLASTAGLLMPLNARTFVPVVGKEVWAKFVQEIVAHGTGDDNAFDSLNHNRFVRLVPLASAPEDLLPATDYASVAQARTLALHPMTVVDIVEAFVQLHVPRESSGEFLALARAELLESARPVAFEFLGLSDLATTDPLHTAATDLYDRALSIAATQHESDGAFRTALAPVLDEARTIGLRSDRTQPGLLIPPSLFHVTAQGFWPAGILGVRYVGHGLHASLVRSTELQPLGSAAGGKRDRPLAGSLVAAVGTE